MKTIVLLAAFLVVVSISNFGQGVPAPLTIRLQPFLSGLSLPVHVVNAGDGTNRLFVVQQRGLIRVVQPGQTTTTDFLNLTGLVSASGNERGLLGLAFHPQYESNRRFFVYYTRNSDGAIEIAEYEASIGNPNVANPSAIRTIITIPHPISNHNGGTIAFGADGFLYAGTGDGGGGNDTANNAQNINSLLGKIIRIDINTPVGQVPAYNNPPTNPYVGVNGADEIYAIGMRNPYRFSFDRGGTNQLWVGDVGQDAMEEVDIVSLGGNYGWRVMEGSICTPSIDPNCTPPSGHIPPVTEYVNAGSRIAVTGGYVYRGSQRTLPVGAYLFADYGTGEIFQWHNGQQTVMLDTPRNISSFGEDEAGELYVVGLGGTVEKVVRAKASADFDGDLRTDLSVFRPSTGVWYAINSSNNSVRIQQFGLNGDIPTPDDYDGDNITDISVYRPTSNLWYYFQSSDATVGGLQFGVNGDVPTPGDFDGDAKSDITIYRPSTGTWWIRRTTDPNNFQAIQFGLSTDIPTAADFDGDGKCDIGVFRSADGDWYRLNSTNGSVSFLHFGLNGDIPVPGDFDADGKADQAVYRPTNGVWYLLNSTSGFQVFQWGINTDIPSVGDYDGDGRDDIAVFRSSNGVWYALRSTSGVLIAPFGLLGDLPVPRFDTP